MKKVYSAALGLLITGTGVMAQSKSQLPLEYRYKPTMDRVATQSSERGSTIWCDDFSDPNNWVASAQNGTSNLWVIGTDVPDGPPVNATYPIGTFREDYEWISHTGDASYLDIHNGRFCVTPDYPNGIYCYFATVDTNHNSAYPYLIGPTYYGNKTGAKVTTVTETTNVYNPVLSTTENIVNNLDIKIFPNPSFNEINIQLIPIFFVYDSSL